MGRNLRDRSLVFGFADAAGLSPAGPHGDDRRRHLERPLDWAVTSTSEANHPGERRLRHI